MMKLKEILHYMNTETTQSIDKNFLPARVIHYN